MIVKSSTSACIAPTRSTATAILRYSCSQCHVLMDCLWRRSWDAAQTLSKSRLCPSHHDGRTSGVTRQSKYLPGPGSDMPHELDWPSIRLAPPRSHTRSSGRQSSCQAQELTTTTPAMTSWLRAESYAAYGATGTVFWLYVLYVDPPCSSESGIMPPSRQ